jgi:hypothetical protein
MAEAPFFKESSHKAAVEKHVSNVPGPTGGSTHGAGVVGNGGAYPTFATPGQDGYGEVTSGTKGHPLTD